MSSERRLINGKSRVLPCSGARSRRCRADTILQSVCQLGRLRSDERVLIMGADLDALELMCSLLRCGVIEVTILRDRLPVAPHSITLILVPSGDVRNYTLNAIDMAPRVLAEYGRLFFWLMSGADS